MMELSVITAERMYHAYASARVLNLGVFYEFLILTLVLRGLFSLPWKSLHQRFALQYSWFPCYHIKMFFRYNILPGTFIALVQECGPTVVYWTKHAYYYVVAHYVQPLDWLAANPGWFAILQLACGVTLALLLARLGAFIAHLATKDDVLFQPEMPMPNSKLYDVKRSKYSAPFFVDRKFAGTIFAVADDVYCTAAHCLKLEVREAISAGKSVLTIADRSGRHVPLLRTRFRAIANADLLFLTGPQAAQLKSVVGLTTLKLSADDIYGDYAVDLYGFDDAKPRMSRGAILPTEDGSKHTASSVPGFSGAPLVNSSSVCVGMHVGGGTEFNSFVPGALLRAGLTAYVVSCGKESPHGTKSSRFQASFDSDGELVVEQFNRAQFPGVVDATGDLDEEEQWGDYMDRVAPIRPTFEEAPDFRPSPTKSRGTTSESRERSELRKQLAAAMTSDSSAPSSVVLKTREQSTSTKKESSGPAKAGTPGSQSPQQTPPRAPPATRSMAVQTPRLKASVVRSQSTPKQRKSASKSGRRRSTK
jgi:hypothetical protein